MSSLPPVYGLLLAGGKSTRMKREKRQLTRPGGESFEDHALALLESHTQQCFLNCNDPANSAQNRTILPDLSPGRGPLAGLEAAFHHKATVAWLVVACDLPNLTSLALSQLIAARSTENDVVCFANHFDQVPEPFVALYEPAAFAKVRQFLATEQYCARRVLEQLHGLVLPSPSAQLHINLNYPEDYHEWRLGQERPTHPKPVTIEYYAKLKEDAQCVQEEWQTASITLAGLWEECRLRHQLSLTLPQVKPAVNNAFCSWDYEIKPGDLIAFMPPFAGG